MTSTPALPMSNNVTPTKPTDPADITLECNQIQLFSVENTLKIPLESEEGSHTRPIEERYFKSDE
jgi:hypothetical protein